MKRVFTFTTLLIVCLPMLVIADVPQMINYQGRLTNSSGDPLDATVSMRFTIYDSETAGLSLWTETHSSVTVDNGTFSVILGEFVALVDVVFNQPDRWLGITVGTDPELTPRTRLVSVAYAHRVSTVDGSSGGIISGDVDIQSDLDVDGTINSWNIDLGSSTQDGRVQVFRNGSISPVISGDLDSWGGKFHVMDELGDPFFWVWGDADGTGGELRVQRSTTQSGFRVDGNYNGTGEPLVAVNGSTRNAVFNMSLTGDASVSLPNNAISATEIEDEPGLARNIVTTAVSLVSGDMQDMVTVDVTIPAAGYIHLTGRCYVRFDNTKSYRSVYIQLDEEAGGSSESGAYVWIYVDSTVSADYYRCPTYVDRVYQKTAGTYTFRLEGTNLSAAGASVDVFSSAITAVYYPTSYGSVVKLVQDPGDHPEAVSVTVAGDDESDRTAYKIDLRYYELQAKEARLRAIQAENDLLEAQAKQQAEARRDDRR